MDWGLQGFMERGRVQKLGTGGTLEGVATGKPPVSHQAASGKGLVWGVLGGSAAISRADAATWNWGKSGSGS